MNAEQNNPTLEQFVKPLKVVEAIGHRNLTLVPVRANTESPLDYLLGQEAIAAGTLVITEVSEGGSVPELLAENKSDKMVLLLDGEELVGAKQNRILNTTVLLQAQSKTKILVSCVEQGRWRHMSAMFAPGHYSPSKLRAHKSRQVSHSLQAVGVAHSDQAAVWEEVECKMAALDAMSPTMAMHDAFEQQHDSLQGYVEALTYPGGARGVIAAINGRFVAADVFDKAATLERIWGRLISGYAMDALGKMDQKASDFTAKGASTLLEHIGQIECRPCPSVGLGKDWRFEAQDVVGQALIVEQTSVHLSVFPNLETDRSRQEGRQSAHITPPSTRRRRPSRLDE